MSNKDYSVMYVADIDVYAHPDVKTGFDKYADIQLINEGGKSILKQCKDTVLGRKVVLKILRPELAGSRKELERLLREARITAQLQHPSTVPLYEMGRDDEGNWYFAMKKLEGQTLFDILVRLHKQDPEAQKQFNLGRLLNIFVQVGDALAYAHARGVIHRDVKPENIIVGRFGEVVLIDWGAAKVWGMPNEGDEDTIDNRGGTPLYMSPEQVLGHRLVDERTDIFSMGVVLYEMLVQREPFRGFDIRDTFDNIIYEDPKPPREVAKDRFIPQVLEEICMKAMEKKPEDRFQSMAELLSAVHKFRDDALLRGSV
ncbi:MAG: serine/threonine protein kinase [Planctomycetales bacterium]|nr:serine/threonine protein kinase [Planctomycetales bacterium]